MEVHFREFQLSRLMLGVVIPMEALIVIFYIFQFGDRPLPLNGFLLLSGLMLLLLGLFYGMTTTIAGETIILSFGIGLITKRINLTEVRSVESVRNPWYYGYGIRWIRNGWLYNVSGAQAVELQFRDRTNVVRIGTKKQEELRTTIQRLIKR